MYPVLTRYSHGGVWQKKAVLVRSSREMKTRDKSLDIIFIKMQDETMKETEKSHRGSSEVCTCIHKERMIIVKSVMKKFNGMKSKKPQDLVNRK